MKELALFSGDTSGLGTLKVYGFKKNTQIGDSVYSSTHLVLRLNLLLA